MYAARCEVGQLCRVQCLTTRVECQLCFTITEVSLLWHSFHPIPFCVEWTPSTFNGAMCKLLMSPCQRVRQVILLSNACVWNVLKLVVGQHNESSLPDRRLGQQFCLLHRHTPAHREIARLSSLQNKPTRPATSSYSHHVATGTVEKFTPFSRRRATELCPHCLASRSASHTTS